MESHYPKPKNLETLDPKEKVDMFICKRRMTFLLQIFYQWRSIAKLGLNKTESSIHRHSGHINFTQAPNDYSLQLHPVQFEMPVPQSVLNPSHRKNFSESNFFTFNRNSKKMTLLLSKLLALKFSREKRFLLRFKFSQWYKNTLFLKMMDLQRLNY